MAINYIELFVPVNRSCPFENYTNIGRVVETPSKQLAYAVLVQLRAVNEIKVPVKWRTHSKKVVMAGHIVSGRIHRPSALYIYILVHIYTYIYSIAISKTQNRYESVGPFSKSGAGKKLTRAHHVTAQL